MREGERLDYLNGDGLCILQKNDGFRFGTDSVLLADFAAPKRGDKVIDLGTGTGILSILMASRRSDAFFDAIEIQPEMAEMAARSVQLNGMEAQIVVHAIDMREAAARLGYGKHTLAVCNPPYGKAGGALVSQSQTQRIARHEDTLTIDEIAASAAALLKVGGRLALIYPAQRAFELMHALRGHHLEPKRIRTIHWTAERAPKHILLDAVKGGGSQLHWLPPLILNNSDGQPSAEWKRIYREE